MIAWVLPIALIALLMRGWALYVLWGWFMVPLGLVPIGLTHALGLSLLVHMLAGTDTLYSDQKDDFEGRFVRSAVQTVIGPLVAVGFGWLLHWFQ